MNLTTRDELGDEYSTTKSDHSAFLHKDDGGNGGEDEQIWFALVASQNVGPAHNGGQAGTPDIGPPMGHVVEEAIPLMMVPFFNLEEIPHGLNYKEYVQNFPYEHLAHQPVKRPKKMTAFKTCEVMSSITEEPDPFLGMV